MSPVGLLALLAAAGAAVWLITWSGGAVADALPARWAETVRQRSEGRLEDARAGIAAMRRDWAGDDAEKNARLDGLATGIDRVEELLVEGRERIRMEAPSRTQVEQFEELDALRRRRPDEPEGIAARFLLAELADLRMGAPQVVPDARPPTAPGGAGDPAMPGANLLSAQLDAVAVKRDARQWSEAAELLRLARETAGPDDGQELEVAAASLRRELRKDLDDSLRRVRQTAAGGQVEDVDGALALARAELARYPAGFAFDALVAEQRDLERWRDRLAEGPAEARPAVGPEDAARSALADARALERDGDFAEAADRIGELAEQARSDDPALAEQLAVQAAELDLIAAFAGLVVERVTAGDDVALRVREQGQVSLALDADGVLEARVDGTAVDFDWSAVDPASLEAFCDGLRLAPRALAGAGVLAYRAGDVNRAEVLLGGAVSGEPELQPILNPVIARGRGEVSDSEGYSYQDGRFVTMAEVRLAARAKDLARELRRLLGRSISTREAALEEIAARGPEEVEALVVAMRDEARVAVERLEKDAFRRQWEGLAKRRRALDDARAQALALIYDEVRYFYPYKPPAVAASRAGEYAAVQREVDERVARVLDLWDTGDKGRPVPRRVRDRLADVEWMLSTLQDFGEPVRGVDNAIEWARALPGEGDGLDIRSFCWDSRERARHGEWARIDRFNEKKLEALHAGEAALVRITNSYRTMLGRPPLPVNTKLCASARGHGEEMALLGFFSHFSPTAGRRSPFDRMRLEGYEQGSSENIANHPGAESAHLGWLRSSGHHRNLLSASHGEFGIGNSGRMWVQNFGGGQDYRNDPDWSED